MGPFLFTNSLKNRLTMLTHEQYQKIKPNLDHLIEERQKERYLYLGIFSEYQLVKNLNKN